MGQKVNCNPLKLTSIVSYLQRTRTVHSIKELEKVLPSVASINGMQVKDYIQSLQDDEKIRVEKIGSGNWYWNFASEDKKTRQQALDAATSAHEKANAIITDLKDKLTEAQAQRDNEAEMLDSGAESREELSDAKAVLEKDIKEFERQLAAYSDTDPTEIERKKEEMGKYRREAGQFTDSIDSMESYIAKNWGDSAVTHFRTMLYGNELDEEGGVLKEI